MTHSRLLQLKVKLIGLRETSVDIFINLIAYEQKICCKFPSAGIINRKKSFINLLNFQVFLFRHLISYLWKIVMKIHHFDKVVINEVNRKTENEFWVSFQKQDCTINCMTIVISIRIYVLVSLHSSLLFRQIAKMESCWNKLN